MVRRGRRRALRSGAPSPPSRSLHPRAVRRHRPAPPTSRDRLVGRTHRRRAAGAASTCGCLPDPTAARRGAARAPRHERAAARAAAERARTRRTCACGSGSTTAAPSCASSTSGRSAGCTSVDTGGADGAGRCPAASPTSPATRSTRASTTRPGRRAAGGAAPSSSGRCSTRPWCPGIGNIYADEALWRARAARRAADRDADAGRRSPALLAAAARGDGRGARGRRHVLRRAVRQRQRRERLLRPLARGLRPRGRAVPAAAARRSGGSSFMNRSSYCCPRCQRRAPGGPCADECVAPTRGRSVPTSSARTVPTLRSAMSGLELLERLLDLSSAGRRRRLRRRKLAEPPPGGSTCRLTSTPVESPWRARSGPAPRRSRPGRGSPRATSTAILRSDSSSMILASHSIRLPSGRVDHPVRHVGAARWAPPSST